MEHITEYRQEEDLRLCGAHPDQQHFQAWDRLVPRHAPWGNSIHFARNWSDFLEPNWSKRTIHIESSRARDEKNRPAALKGVVIGCFQGDQVGDALVGDDTGGMAG